VTSSSGERLFSVTVSPEDGLSSLYQEIEGATGVKASQQRLIYRGRIINDQSSPGGGVSGKGLNNSEADDKGGSSGTIVNHDNKTRRIRDIAGLCDGQTIHLVKKRDTSSTGNTEDVASNSATTGRSSTETSRSSMDRGSIEADIFNGSTASGSGGGALLAALLGLGSLTEDVIGPGVSPTAEGSFNPSLGASRGRSHRRPHYRLAAADLQVPDPGSMEPVRQGLMTLHTLLPHSQIYSEDGTSPLEANREWFRGQWLDCRDTVNQWLEATVVDILRPDDILPTTSSPLIGASTRRRPANVDNDPAVSANDLEGRRRLLLEPCRPGDPEELSGDLVGFRPRSNNNGVQLLLIHYNGWPHRWDEWM
jgi:hypothetical protein